MGRRQPGRRLRGIALALLAGSATACAETVAEVVTAASVQVSGPTLEIAPGESTQLTAVVVGSDGRVLSQRSISWNSSASGVASVDPTGRVTGHSPGLATITASSEGRSGDWSLTVRSAVPALTSVSPSAVTESAAFTLTVLGSGFFDGSVVRWNDADRPTEFVSAGELRASISSGDVLVQGSASVTVFNPAPGGGTSNALPVSIQIGDPCEQPIALALGANLSGQISASDCELADGSLADLYRLTVATTQALTFRMTSTTIDSFLQLTDTTGARLLAFNDDDETSLNSRLTVLLPAGTYHLAVTTLGGDELGSYSVSLESGPASLTGCSEMWLIPGVQTTQSVGVSDCSSSLEDLTYYGDRYAVYLRTGETLTVEMTSTEVDPYLLALEPVTLAVLAQDDDGGGSLNALLTFTAPGEGVYLIEASTAAPLETGAYTLRVP